MVSSDVPCGLELVPQWPYDLVQQYPAVDVHHARHTLVHHLQLFRRQRAEEGELSFKEISAILIGGIGDGPKNPE